jgi:hypothetical protein
MKTCRLENWSVGSSATEYSAPETIYEFLCGEVYSHPKFTDGDKIRTSQLIELSVQEKRGVTQNTIYELGEPDPDYVQWCKERGKELKDYK